MLIEGQLRWRLRQSSSIRAERVPGLDVDCVVLRCLESLGLSTVDVVNSMKTWEHGFILQHDKKSHNQAI